jgi:hypothetical protein
VTARHLANKFKRAIRNDTGTHFSADELRRLGEWGLMDILLAEEAKELSAKWAGPSNDCSPLAGSGLPGASNRHSTRSAGMTRPQRQLAAKALVAGR